MPSCGVDAVHGPAVGSPLPSAVLAPGPAMPAAVSHAATVAAGGRQGIGLGRPEPPRCGAALTGGTGDGRVPPSLLPPPSPLLMRSMAAALKAPSSTLLPAKGMWVVKGWVGCRLHGHCTGGAVQHTAAGKVCGLVMGGWEGVG